MKAGVTPNVFLGAFHHLLRGFHFIGTRMKHSDFHIGLEFMGLTGLARRRNLPSVRRPARRRRVDRAPVPAIPADLRGDTGTRIHRVADLRTALKEKEALLREVHHRAKNNLQIIASLLSLQSGYICDSQTRTQLREIQQRIRSMALIHEKLYQSESLATVDLADYVQSLMSILMLTYTSGNNVNLECRVSSAVVSIDTAVPIGLMLNELVTNALKYAFPNDRPGHLLVVLDAEAGGQLALCVQDDGVGLSPDFRLEQASTLGLRLVQMFAKQLRANVTLRSEPGHTAFDIHFKEEVAKSP
jgi:two-component sensor histidine kinase